MPGVGAHQAGTPPVPPQPGTPVPPYGVGVPPQGTEAPRPAPKRPGWVPIVATAAIAAVLASGGTAAIVLATDTNQPQAASMTTIGTDNNSSGDSVPVQDSNSQNPNWEAVSKAVSPSVVAITVTTQQGGAEGSGFVIDTDGHVLTNNHVVSGAQQVQVTMNDGTIYDAKIVGTDPTTDLAVIQIENPPSKLTPVSMGDSSKVTVGESVLAVGNPLGLANTASTGIVSAVDRPVSASGEEASSQPVTTNAIQIDAAINPGNSGGPLFNSAGQVIGITSSIATMSSGDTSGQSGSIGIGFAIPINLAQSISKQLIDNGSAEHAYLGVKVSDDTVTADGVTRRGAKVAEVTSGGPAEAAGVQVGDVIVAIDDQAVSGADSLVGYVREENVGDTATLTIVRDGKTENIDVKLDAQPTDTNTENPQGGSGGSNQDNGSGGFGWNQSYPSDLPWSLVG